VRRRRCEDEKMFYRPPLLEEPCAQTLSGKKTMGLLLFMTCQSLKSLVGLGDCWLMAALACLAEYPAKLKGLFESKHITEVMGADGCRAKESIFTA